MAGMDQNMYASSLHKRHLAHGPLAVVQWTNKHHDIA